MEVLAHSCWLSQVLLSVVFHRQAKYTDQENARKRFSCFDVGSIHLSESIAVNPPDELTG